MDLLPTSRNWSVPELAPHKIDGKDIWPLMAGKRAPGRRARLFFTTGAGVTGGAQRQVETAFPHNFSTPEPTGPTASLEKNGNQTNRIGLFDLEMTSVRRRTCRTNMLTSSGAEALGGKMPGRWATR